MSTPTRVQQDAAAIPASLLDAARALVAQADSAAGPTVAPAGFTEPIDIHVLVDGWQFESGAYARYYKRGDELTIHPAQVESPLWTDRGGNQLFGKTLDAGVRIARGPFPTHLRPFTYYGDLLWREQRLEASTAAAKIEDPDRRAAAEAEVLRKYGERSGSLAAAARFYQGTIHDEHNAWDAQQVEAAA